MKTQVKGVLFLFRRGRLLRLTVVNGQLVADDIQRGRQCSAPVDDINKAIGCVGEQGNRKGLGTA